MNEKPILFQGEMVRAILEGRKTETRRVVTPQPREDEHGFHFPWATFYNTGHVHTWDRRGTGGENWQALEHPAENKYAEALKRTQYKNASPYGQPGDRLWVRETWGVGSRPCPHRGGYDGIEYKADEAYLEGSDLLPLHEVEPPDGVELDDYMGGWRPSIHMFRWASRINLEVTEVRVERVQDITEDAAVAEGTRCHLCGGPMDGSIINECACIDGDASARESFRHLWDSINAKRWPKWARRREDKGKPTDRYAKGHPREDGPLSWEANPWVWVVKFQLVK